MVQTVLLLVSLRTFRQSKFFLCNNNDKLYGVVDTFTTPSVLLCIPLTYICIYRYKNKRILVCVTSLWVCLQVGLQVRLHDDDVLLNR